MTQVHENTGNTNLDWQQSFSYDRWGNRLINNNSNATWGDGINNVVATIDPISNQMYASGDMSLPMNQRQVQYDAAGNQTKDYLTSNGTRTYDAENRMITATDSSNHTSTYSYDGDGHRVKRNISNTETWQVYGLGGELIAEYAQNGAPNSPQKEYGYRNGQLLVTATATTGWGSAPALNDNPLSVGQTTVQARHITELRTAINALRSHMNLSAYSWQYSATTNDYISADQILEMRTALDQALGAPSGGYAAGLAQGQPVKAIHIQELRDRLLAAWQSGSGVDIRWLVSDQLGTPRMIFDQSGSLANVSRHDYLPFGEELFAGTGGRTTAQGYSASDGVRQHFSQKERDNETGLDYFLTRYYASTQGRFTSYDSIFVTAKRLVDPQRLNLYAYARNNPLKFIDADGMDITITAKNEEDGKKKFNIYLLGFRPADRSHVHFSVGDGKNGYKKGQFYVLVDKDYKSDSKNFLAAQKGANDRADEARITVLHKGDTYTLRSLSGSIYHPTLESTSGTFAGKDDFQGYTMLQIRGKGAWGEMYSAGNYSESYVNGDQDDIELSTTMHHEYRAHVILGDFGRNIPRARHSDAYARGKGPPTSEADKEGEAAEKETRENAAKKP